MSILTVPLAEMKEIDHPDQLQRVLAVVNLIINGKQADRGKDKPDTAKSSVLAS